MSQLYVDTITEKTAGNGVQIPGHVVQVVQERYTTAASFAVNTFTASGLSASITPSSTSSKILVTGYMMGAGNEGGQEGIMFRLYRDASHVSAADGVAVSNRIGVFAQAPAYTGDSEGMNTIPYDYLDSPSTTSSVTYSIYTRGFASSYPVFINRSLYDYDRNFNNRGVCVMTLMEIAQ
jgi:hypothetical protein